MGTAGGSVLHLALGVCRSQCPRTPRNILAALTSVRARRRPARVLGARRARCWASPDSGATADVLPGLSSGIRLTDVGHVYVRVLRRSGVQLDAHDHHHEEHACDAEDALPERDVLLARPLDNSSTGVLGDWSEVRDLDVEWAANPDLLGPADGATITYPSEALELKWDVVPGASKYDVKVATDPDLGTLVYGEPIETGFDAVQPQRAAPRDLLLGDRPPERPEPRGEPSDVASFAWSWPRPRRRRDDLVSAPEVDDPRFSWNPVVGAAGYEVEINFSSDWASGSQVCCDPINSSARPRRSEPPSRPPRPRQQHLLLARPRDRLRNNAGDWNEGRPSPRQSTTCLPSRHPASRTSACATTSPTPPSTPTPGRPSRHRVPVVTGTPSRGLRLQDERDAVLGRRLRLGHRALGQRDLRARLDAARLEPLGGRPSPTVLRLHSRRTG